jgi:hypothetical protein
MDHPNEQIAQPIETEHSMSADDVSELGVVSDTKGGPGIQGDGHGGFIFP